MFDRIEKGLYWDKAWTLVSGCTPCSPGCTHCWALAMEKRFRPQKGIQIHPERLDIPLKRKKPTVYAIWNDLLHEDVPNNFLSDVFRILEKCPQHIFLVLTKRAKGMADYLDGYKIASNIWLCVTVCNQQEADEKISILLKIQAAVHFISYEPALGPLIKWWLDGNCESERKPSWLICGGESGPGARPMHPEWARLVRDQCQAAGVPFFFKQWGEWSADDEKRKMSRRTRWIHLDGTSSHPYPELSQYRSELMCYIGKKVAGRILDGRTWDELPEVKRRTIENLSIYLRNSPDA